MATVAAPSPVPIPTPSRSAPPLTLALGGLAAFGAYSDASGYAGSVALLLFRSLGAPHMRWLPFFIDCAYVTALAVGALTLLSALSFLRSGQRGSMLNEPA